jgi:hypothetical protein
MALGAPNLDASEGGPHVREVIGDATEIAPAQQLQGWPVPLEKEALHGPAGDFVRLVEPHTEADPAALLTQFLTAIGNLIGRHIYRIAEGMRHYPNLFNVLVGRTGHGRKGSAYAQVRRLLRLVDEEWVRLHIQGGLASGEGLIWAVRDPIEHREPIKEKGRYTGEYQTAEVDPGVGDKRLLVVETEFARVMKVSARDSNTLSVTMREAWDHGDLQGLTKNSPVRATGAHISIIGHITDEELLRNLESTEVAAGSANRILWTCARRSKLLPRGGSLRDEDFGRLVVTLLSVIQWAAIDRELGFSDAAWRAWDQAYPVLTAGRPGLLGAILGRAEAQVLRLAILYAGLDNSPVIDLVHLKAAVAVWDYCANSVEYVFGDRLGDPDADAILGALRTCTGGLTRTEIRDLFSRNLSAPRIERALAALVRSSLARPETVTTGGRPAEKWKALYTTKTIYTTKG